MKKEDFLKLGLDEDTALKCEMAWDKELELSLADRDTQLATLKNSTGDIETLKTQITALQEENIAKDESHKTEVKQLKIESAIDTVIGLAKGKNAKAIRALLDLNSLEILEDGSIKGLSGQMETLAKAEDSKFLFDTSKPQIKGAKPSESGKEDLDNGINISKMSYEEICVHLDNN